MKHITISTLIMMLLSATTCLAQTAIKPTIMVVPDANWCIKNGYTKADGRTVDYERALSNDDLRGSIIEMNNFMAGIEYPMESLSEHLKSIHDNAAIDKIATAADGSKTEEDDLDKILRSANADIMVSLALNNKPYGPRRIIEFQLESVDAASRKSIQGNIGTSSPSNSPAPTLIQEAVASFMDNFLQKINSHFSNMATNGREGIIRFKIAENCPYNLKDKITIPGEGEGELCEYIEYWLGEHTVDGAPRPGNNSRYTAEFSQVRIPLYGVKTSGFGKNKNKPVALTAESFIKDIIPDLEQLGISAYVVPQGVGKATVILGGL